MTDDEIAPGTVAWSKPLRLPDDLDITQPFLEGNDAYVVASRKLIRFDLPSGKKIWERGLETTTEVSGRKVLSDGNLLFLNHTNWVRAFDKQTGAIVWETTFARFTAIRRAFMDQNATHLFLGGRGEVLGIRKQDGTIDLRISVDQLVPAGVTQSAYDPEVRENGLLYVPTAYFREGARATEGNLLVFDAETGAFVWGHRAENRQIPLPQFGDTLVIDAAIYAVELVDDVVIFSSGQSIVSLNRYTGDFLWETFFHDQGFDIALTSNEETLFAGSLSQHMIALNIDDGNEIWQQFTPGSITSILTVDSGRLYFCNPGGGQLWVLDARTGVPIWNDYPPDYKDADRESTYLAPLAVGKEYMLAVGSKQIYCLKKP